jgi:hypothetical protein
MATNVVPKVVNIVRRNVPPPSGERCEYIQYNGLNSRIVKRCATTCRPVAEDEHVSTAHTRTYRYIDSTASQHRHSDAEQTQVAGCIHCTGSAGAATAAETSCRWRQIRPAARQSVEGRLLLSMSRIHTRYDKYNKHM